METVHSRTTDPPEPGLGPAGVAGPTGPTGVARRSVLAGMGAALAGGAMGPLSGCAASVRGLGKTVLQVVSLSSEVDDKLIADFQRRNPDIRISLIQPSWDVIVSMLAAGTPPDVVRGAGAQDTSYLVARGLAEPLDDYLDRSTVLRRADLDPVNDLWRFDGHTQGKGPYYGFCKDYSSDLTLWAEKDRLEAAGVPMPGTGTPLTYDQILQIAKKVGQSPADRKNRTLGFGTVFGGKPDFSMVQAMMATAGASPFNDELTEVDLTVDAGVRSIDWFMELIASRTTSSFLMPQSVDDVSLYVAGRTALCMSGYWTTGLVATAKPDVRRASYLLPAPQMGGTRVSPCVGGTGLWIPRKSKNKEAAWRFMEYYFGGKAAADRAKTGWGTPSLRSLVKYLPTREPFQQRSLHTQLSETRYFQVLPFTPYAKLSGLGTALATVFEQGYRGHKSARHIAEESTKAMNALIKQGRRKV